MITAFSHDYRDGKWGRGQPRQKVLVAEINLDRADRYMWNQGTYIQITMPKD